MRDSRRKVSNCRSSCLVGLGKWKYKQYQEEISKDIPIQGSGRDICSVAWLNSKQIGLRPLLQAPHTQLPLAAHKREESQAGAQPMEPAPTW